MKIQYNSNFRADSTNRADSSLEWALFFNGIGGSDSGLKMESQQLYAEPRRIELLCTPRLVFLPVLHEWINCHGVKKPETRVVASSHRLESKYLIESPEGRLTVTKKNWVLYFVMTILWWQFRNLKVSAKRAPICSSFCSHFSSTKMSSQNAFSTPKSIHINKINSQIGLFNSREKWVLISLRKSIWGQNQLVRCFFGDC